MKKIYIVLVIFFLLFVIFYDFEKRKFNFNIFKINVSLNHEARMDYFTSLAGSFLSEQAPQRSIGSINRKETDIEKTYPKSAFYKKISFGSGYNVLSVKPSEEFLVFDVSEDLVLPVRIDGWKIFEQSSNKGYEIPKAIGKTLPTISQPKNTIVYPGDKIILSSGFSPIGQSLKIHKCLGYREQFQNFNPIIKASCPTPKEEFLRDAAFNDNNRVCQLFVEEIPICTAIRNAENLPKKCINFIQSVFTEEACIIRHHNDSDFLLSEWRLYLNQKGNLWNSKKAVILLLDEHNKLVDHLIY